MTLAGIAMVLLAGFTAPQWDVRITVVAVPATSISALCGPHMAACAKVPRVLAGGARELTCRIYLPVGAVDPLVLEHETMHCYGFGHWVVAPGLLWDPRDIARGYYTDAIRTLQRSRERALAQATRALARAGPPALEQ